MGEDELFALIKLMEEELRAAGLSDLVGPVLYLDRRDGLEGTEVGLDDLSPSRTYLLGLLEAFDRHLAVRSDDARREAIDCINKHQEGERLEDVAVLLADAEGDTEEMPLVGLQNVRPLRANLREIIDFVESVEIRPNPGLEM